MDTATPHRDPERREETLEYSSNGPSVGSSEIVARSHVQEPVLRARFNKKHRRRFSSLRWSILAINVLALAILFGGLLLLGEYRIGLIEAKKEALLTQGEIIASSLGQSAITGAPETIELDLLRSRALIPRLVVPTGTRARLFDLQGRLVADSQTLAAARREVSSRALPPPSSHRILEPAVGLIYDFLFETSLAHSELLPYREDGMESASDFEEVASALLGNTSAAERVTVGGEVIINAALPIQGFKKVLGALMLTGQTADIVDSVRAVRLAILETFVAALAITVLLSLFLAGTIARPIRRLAEAADRVRGGSRELTSIPDFARRGDEIGDLSIALRDMTAVLHKRLNEIEAFAADVAHEIRNPLSSISSAVEALERTDEPRQRVRLGEIIKNDIRRLNQLIGDISDASRIDAELSRASRTEVDISALVITLSEIYQATGSIDGPTVVVELLGSGTYVVGGLEDRLGQVFRNLIDNARSFSPQNGTIRVGVHTEDSGVVVTVDDDGPGIPDESLEAVFDRFYRSRPAGEHFGIHSGLGLSISRQIVEAHGGTIRADRWHDGEGRVGGARIIVWLPK